MSTKREQGLQNRFVVCRVDENGNPKAGHEDRQYFVLDIYNDPHAVEALTAYARNCNLEYPELSKDLLAVAKEAANRRATRLLTEVKDANQ